MRSANYSKTSTNANAYLEKLVPEARALIDGGSPLDRPIRLTTFPKQGAQRKREVRLSMRQLATKIRNTEAEDKTHLPWLKGAVFGDKPTPLRPDPAKPGRMTGNSLRHDANVVAVTGVELDYDAGVISPETARDRLKRAGVTALVYTTPSHTPAAPRWRVLAPCSTEVTPDRRAALVARLNGLLDGDVDGASFTLSQSYYFGNVKGRPRVRAFPIEGRRYIDQAADLDATAVGRRARHRANDNAPPAGPFDEAGLIEDLLSGANYHGSAMSLLGHWAVTGVSYLECRARIYDAFHSIPEDDRRDVWSERVASIPEMLAYIFGKQITESYESRERLLALYEDLPDEEEEARAPVAGLTFSTPSECAVGDARQYVIKGIVAAGDVACIVGAPGVGKSLLAPRLGYAVAQGQDIFGMRTRQGGVFYVAAEDEHGMRSRVTALKDQHGDADQFVLVGGVSDLLVKGSAHLKALCRAVQERRPSLIIIDTLAMAFPGLEENTAEGMGRVVATSRSLTKWGAAVILIHHDTKDGQQGLPRGHSLLNGALDVSLHLTKDGGIIRGKLTKNRNGPCERDITFSIGTRPVGTDEDGDLIWAAICCELDQGSAPKREDRLSPSAKAAFETLREMLDGCQAVPEIELREACVSGRKVSASEDPDSRRRAYKRAVEELTRKGTIIFRDGQYRSPEQTHESLDRLV
ncbi:MAG: AAA family ATPase [Mesorhizobium sp.]|nr:MAG: AAA family ATPase [Mesorhizobium sp.]